MKVSILGVKIDDINIDEAVSIVEGWLSKPGKRFIVTPNPEFLVIAQKDAEFKKIINSADLAIPDGVGLRLAGVKNNVPGVDLMEKLVRLAAKNGYIVGLLGGRDKVAEKAAERLVKKYHKLQILFASDGGQVNEFHTTDYILPTIDLLFIAFGAPKQEKWIASNLNKIPVKVAMGVGGAFDYLSGNVPRAPKWIRNLGLEWAFRLIIQPWRMKRQLSLLKFIWYIIRHGEFSRS